MTKRTFKLLCAAAVGALLLSGCAASNGNQVATSGTQCPSKWVAAGNNGAKADRYVQPGCQ